MIANPLLLAGLAAGLLAACWRQLRALAVQLSSLGVARIQVDNTAGSALRTYLWTHLRRSPFGSHRYGSATRFVQPRERYLEVGFETLGTEPMVFWMGWRPLLARWHSPSQADPGLGITMSVSCLRGSFDLEQLLVAALEEYNAALDQDAQGSRFRVERAFGPGSRRKRDMFARSEGGASSPTGASTRGDNPGGIDSGVRYLSWQGAELGATQQKAPFGALALPRPVLAVVEHVRRWLGSRSWYRERRIPWRLGLLLHGLPGCGKSSLALALAQELGLPVLVFDLAGFDNESFATQWESWLSHAPCMALFEDIDAIFDGRTNSLGEEGGGLTFDCFLNCISGVRDSSGVLTIITTNRVERLDEALGRPDPERGGLSTRPGRIDRVVELPPLDAECRRQVAKRILKDCLEEVEGLVAVGEGDSGAQFQCRCEQVALAHYWKPGAP